MQTILDIDLDFFVTNIANNCESYGRRRLSEDEGYLPKSELIVKSFLEANCRLSTEKKTPGKAFEDHDEVFYYWRGLVNQGFLKPPFEVVHVDAHSDLGSGFADASWIYITTKYLHFDLEARQEPSRGKKGINPGNYLIFAVACGWISKLIFILHPEWRDDINAIHMKDFNPDADIIQLKKYEPEQLKKFTFDIKTIPYSIDQKAPFEKVPQLNFQAKSDYDLICITRSPGYTPRSADKIYELINQYIETYPKRNA